MLNLEHL